MSASAVHGVEAGEASSIDGYARLAVALGLEPSFSLHTERPASIVSDMDPVHAAMAEIEATHLRALGFEVMLDEPYQHYQFAGRADVIALDRERRALLHLENRTRFPDIQAAIGSYNAKRAYLASELAHRLGIRGGLVFVTHLIVALWSAEVLHTVRLRENSFRSVCPEPPDDFAAWWSGAAPASGGSTSSFILFDPLPARRSSRRRWVGLDDLGTVEPRYRGYADALDRLRSASAA